MDELEERCLVDNGEAILNKKAVYEPSKTQRFRQIVCSRGVAACILVAMGILMVAIAVIAAFARPASLSDSCGAPSSSGSDASSGHGAAKTYISTNGEPFPWKSLRLPRSVSPEAYSIYLNPNVSESWYSGRVSMELRVDRPTDFLVFHSSKVTVSEVHVSLKRRAGPVDAGGVDVREVDLGQDLEVLKVLEYPGNEQVYVQLSREVPAGAGLSLRVSFNGSFSDLSDMSGFYKSSYTVGGEKRYMVSTHFEATFARSAFPCMDEPELKATFALSIVREQRHISLFNTQLLRSEPHGQGLLLDVYEPSKKMSTYLVAFVVCDFKNMTRRTQDGDGVEVRMFAPEDKIYMGSYALEAAVTVLERYNTFFGVRYPLRKLDLIAIPNFSAGAMENWGLVTFRDTSVLYDPSKDTEGAKQWVAIVVAHELAHQWFGNLVTMEWWDDLWLNEGFASFVEYIGADTVDKEFRMMDQFSKAISTAQYRDSFTSSHPIQVKVADPEEIELAFDSISYSKGASLIRMLQSVVGDEAFKSGLSAYLRKYSYSNARTSDLWQAFQEASDLPSDLSVSKVMDTWTKQMGYPVVLMSRDKGKLQLMQERFLISGEKSAVDDGKFTSPFGYTWHVPFTFRTSSNPREKTLIWLRRGSASAEIPDSEALWVTGNTDGKGYYRVQYDPAGWQAIIRQLKEDHTVFSVSDRVALVSDAFSLARAGRINYSVPLDMSGYLSKEQDYFVWSEASSHFGFLKGRLFLDEDYDLLKDYEFSLAKPHYDRLGWSDTGNHIEKKMRAFLIGLAIVSEYQPAVSRALELFHNWVEEKPFSVLNDLRGSIYSVGLRYGNHSEWNLVLQRYQKEKTPSERRTLLSALAATRDARILQTLLEHSMDGVTVKSQDTGTVITNVAANTNGQLLAWRFFRQRWDDIFARYGKDAFLLSSTLKSVTDSFNTKFDYDEIATFFKGRDVGSAQLALQQSLEIVQNHIDWAEGNLQTIKSWLKTNVRSTPAK
ncbi:endoplasmic reticulum aminopeptidase 1 [Aplysia californica]|uniref:Aminopeptidase n=1 Tax=Aplysia californica TaxID=6500 RepID=A0ABM1AB88_APLCA|nr:endoplasmic reticulum aminopeptidase 1 [Aplysia californica]